MVASNTPEVTMLGVMARTSTAAARDSFSLARNATNGIMVMNGTSTTTDRMLYRDNASVLASASVGSTDTNYHAWYGRTTFSGTTVTASMSEDNATPVTTNAVVGVITINNATIGCRYSNTVRINYWIGTICELAAFNRALSAAEINVIDADILDFWAV
jgi:hypothetical protein